LVLQFARRILRSEDKIVQVYDIVKNRTNIFFVKELKSSIKCLGFAKDFIGGNHIHLEKTYFSPPSLAKNPYFPPGNKPLTTRKNPSPTLRNNPLSKNGNTCQYFLERIISNL